VKDFERGHRKPIANNLDAMRRAIEAAGVNPLFSDSGEAFGIVTDGFAIRGKN
jgi:hypothetical protein